MAQNADQTDPAGAVFRIMVMELESNRGVYYGTAFFIASDGTALTASHVVYRVVHDPNKYRLLAIVDKEFYDASVVCASRLPYDASTQKTEVPISLDVAKIRLAPATASFSQWSYRTKDGQVIPIATAHRGDLPPFPFLTIGGHPLGHVRVVGFGGISPIPYVWTAEGHVERSWNSRVDGTPLFDITSQNPAVPGDSGAPVLNDQNQVVGLWAWRDHNTRSNGTAQDNSVLLNPCK